MTTISSACARLRLSFEAKITGREAPVTLKSYLHFAHYRRLPPPDVDTSAPCAIRLLLDFRMGDNSEVESRSWDVHNGCLLFTKGGARRFAGYRLPVEALESIIPTVRGALIEIGELGWNVSDAKERLTDMRGMETDQHCPQHGSNPVPTTIWAEPCLLIPACSLPALTAKRRTMTIAGVITEHWIIRI